MAQLTYNTMRFGTDNFKITEDTATALLIAKEPLVKNFEWSILEEFIIDADIPAGTDVRFAFTTDVENRKDQIFILKSENSKAISMERLINPDSWLGVGAYTVDDITADIVLENGNTITSLQALNGLELASGNIDAKRYFRPIIALFGVAGKKPKVKLGVKVSDKNSKTDAEHTHTIEFDNLTKIVGFPEREIEITGDASATVTAACKTTKDGDFGDYLPLDDLIDKKVYALRVKDNLHVGTPKANDSVKVKCVCAATEDTECKTFGDDANIFSITKNYYLPLKYCVVVVKHAELNGAQIKAFVKIDPNIYFANRKIGTGTGSTQTITLPTTIFVDVSTLKVYVNGTQTTNYTFRAADNTITINAANGAAINASYNYNLKAEEWLELDADPTQYDISDGKFTTRYSSKISKTNSYVSAVKLQLIRAPENDEQTITLPITPTGEEQTYRLSGTGLSATYFSVFNSAGTAIFSQDLLTGAKSGFNTIDCDVSFRPSTSTLTFTVPAGNYTIKVKYKKNAPVPKIYSWTAGWCV